MLKRTIDFLASNWAEVVVCMVITLFIFWSIGYFCNALIGTKFELQSCWLGVAAVTTAGVISLGKYWADSIHNTLPGQMPGIQPPKDIQNAGRS